MENDAAREALATAHRAALAPWLDARGPGWWNAPLTAVTIATAALAWWLPPDRAGQTVPWALLALVVLTTVLNFAQLRSIWATGQQPRELRNLGWLNVAGLLGSLLLAWPIGLIGPTWVAVASTGVSAGVVQLLHDRARSRAVAEIKARFA